MLLTALDDKLKNSPDEYHELYLREADWFLEDPTRFDVYEHRPVPIREWIDRPYGGNMNDVIRPRIKQMLVEIFENPGAYDEVVIIGGIGIGKSFISGTAVGYLMHRLACLRSPKNFFSLGGANPIAIMNMSVNATQAKKIVFSQILESTNAPWFRLMDFVADSEVKSELRFPKYVQVMPGNSQDTFFIGFDLYAGVLDEGAWHQVTDEKDYAEEGYSAMQRRVKSRFPGHGMLFIVTSPRYVDDFVERKIREAAHNPRIYARRIRAWESMPPNADVSSYFYFDPDRDILMSQAELDSKPEWKDIVEDRTIITPKREGTFGAKP